jgi:peptide/nickel transport system substrate-binding protein
MTRFEEYWGGTEQFHTKNIVVKYIPDLNTAAAALQAGEVDYAFILNNSSYYAIDADPNINITKAQGCMSYYMGINSRKDMWKNVEMRRALAMAINKQDIVNIQFEDGIGATVNNNFCVPSGAGHTEIKPLEYNVDAAKAIVDANNATGTKVVIMATAAYKAMAEVVQANLNAVGFNAQIDFVDSTNWTTLKSTYDYDVFIGDYASYTGALLYNFNRFFTVGGSSNLFGFESEEWENMMLDMQKCTTYDEMLTKFATMQQWVVDNVPLIPIAINNAFGYAREGVGGVKVAPSYNLQELHWLYKIEK